MNIIISNASGKPIYEQIFDQMRNMIISGELNSGDVLPSIRSLAKDLRISVITTNRAYDELEKSGLINRVAGKGCFVAEKNMELVREEHYRQIETLLAQVVELAAPCGLKEAEIEKMLRLLWGDQGKDE